MSGWTHLAPIFSGYVSHIVSPGLVLNQRCPRCPSSHSHYCLAGEEKKSNIKYFLNIKKYSTVVVLHD